MRGRGIAVGAYPWSSDVWLSTRAGGEEPTEIFAFGMEQRLQCVSCGKVRYRTDSADALSVPVYAREKGKDDEGKVLYEDVRLEECVEGVMGAEGLEYACPSCARNVQATKWVLLPCIQADAHAVSGRRVFRRFRKSSSSTRASSSS